MLVDVKPPKLGEKKKDKPKTRKIIRPTWKQAALDTRKELEELEKKKAYLDSLKKLTKLTEGKGPSIVNPNEVQLMDNLGAQDKEVIFEPNPGPQYNFLASSEREVLFGGARGGGKSFALLVDPLRYCEFGNARALILRKTIPELRDMMYKAQYLYPKAYGPKTRFNKTENTFYFPSGARIEFGYAESLNDANRYQGQSYSWIGVDEIAQYATSEILDLLRASLRSTDPFNVPIQLRLTANPGNIGSGWLKEQFVDPSPPNTTFEVTVQIQMPGGQIVREVITRKFIPARVWDNPYLIQDLSYAAMLANLPEIKRKQWLDGNWEIYEGAAFPEFDRNIHVVQPFAIPSHWYRFRGADWGYATPGCVLWLAVDPSSKQLVVYRELWFKGMTAPEVANKIHQLEENENVQWGVLDVSAWTRRGEMGDSIAMTMNKMGCRWRPSGRVIAQGVRTSRISGKMEVHRRLSINPIGGKPNLVMFSNCVNLIKTLPTLPLDKNDLEDVDSDSNDHAYDALRYACMARPSNIGGLVVDRNNPGIRSTHYIVDPVFGY